MFLTCDRAAADALLARVRARWPDALLVGFANDEDRDWLAARHATVELRRDKPPGGRLAFVRALRRERFAEVVVAWHGGERLQPLRLAALALGRLALATDERGNERRVGWWRPWTWGPHLLRRGLTADPLFVARCLAACYRATLGLVLALVWLPLRLAVLRLCGRPGRPA
ncbi:MAG: hypothetical protein JNL08_13300 [Planctomycetes bacterium]|nr:hypothetical protein [Planctomycetota bacterium]